MRELIQNKLEELTDVESGNFISDDIVVDGQTYFGYSIYSNYLSNDNAKNDVRNYTLIGYVVRRENPEEDTLSIVDKSVDDIVKKLKEINFKSSFSDVTLTDLRKVRITANCLYNEINNEII